MDSLSYPRQDCQRRLDLKLRRQELQTRVEAFSHNDDSNPDLPRQIPSADIYEFPRFASHLLSAVPAASPSPTAFCQESTCWSITPSRPLGFLVPHQSPDCGLWSVPPAAAQTALQLKSLSWPLPLPWGTCGRSSQRCLIPSSAPQLVAKQLVHDERCGRKPSW